MLNHLEYEREEVVGNLRFEDILTGGSKIFYKTHFLPMLMMQHRVDEMFLSFCSKSGKEYPVLMNMVLSEVGEEMKVQVVGLQIAKRNKYEKGIIEAKKAAEKALKENELLLNMKSKLEAHQQLLEQNLRDVKRINKEQIEFSKILSHDLQEPLRKIQLFAGLLEERTEQESFNPKFISYLQKLQELSKFSRELLGRLQSVFSLEGRMNKGSVGKLDSMVNVALSEIGLVGIQLDDSQLKIKDISGDIPKLTKVLAEIIYNAHQFRNQDRPLSVKISSDLVKENYYKAVEGAYRYADFVQIRIRDNAQGFPDNGEGKLFGLLQKFHPESGRGLGLAYCKKIVELHQGQISMKRIAGGGSEFIILLPFSHN